MKCINCKNSNLVKIVKIGHQPISSLFYKKKNKIKISIRPILMFQCKLVQLSKLVHLKICTEKVMDIIHL